MLMSWILIMARRKKWSQFDQKVTDKAVYELMEGDLIYGNIEKAKPHMTTQQSKEIYESLRRGVSPDNYGKPELEILLHYMAIHSVLIGVSEGNLRNKNILHMGAATGVYTKFLQKFYHSQTIGIDTDLHFLKNAISRTAKGMFRGNVIPSKVKVTHPKKGSVVNHIPIKSGSMDYVLSQHFLFANYDKVAGGFEKAKNSTRVSEETLKEIRRILKQGGRLIVTEAHADELKQLRKFNIGYEINGFVVEIAHKLSKDRFRYRGEKKPIKNPGAIIFVLKKL